MPRAHVNPGRLNAAPQMALSGSCRGLRQTDGHPSARHRQSGAPAPLTARRGRAHNHTATS